MLSNTFGSRIASALSATSALVLMASALLFAGPPAKAASLVGQTAPGFSLPNVATGAPTSLDSLRQGKKAVVLIYISTQCPVSNAYNGRMEALATAYESKGIVFAGINSNVNEPTQEVAAHARSKGFSFAVLKDAGSVTADAYGARHTPEVYVVGAKGVVVYHGRIDDSMDQSSVQSHDLAAALDEIVAGKPVANPETKAFGCAIKRPHAD